MSALAAPLYVRCHDLAEWLLRRVADWRGPLAPALGPPVAAAALDLLTAVSVALTFPETRAAHQARADEAIVRLRVLLRLAAAVELLDERRLAHATDALRPVGKMLGGWRKRTGHEP